MKEAILALALAGPAGRCGAKRCGGDETCQVLLPCLLDTVVIPSPFPLPEYHHPLPPDRTGGVTPLPRAVTVGTTELTYPSGTTCTTCRGHIPPHHPPTLSQVQGRRCHRRRRPLTSLVSSRPPPLRVRSGWSTSLPLHRTGRTSTIYKSVGEGLARKEGLRDWTEAEAGSFRKLRMGWVGLAGG